MITQSDLPAIFSHLDSLGIDTVAKFNELSTILVLRTKLDRLQALERQATQVPDNQAQIDAIRNNITQARAALYAATFR